MLSDTTLKQTPLYQEHLNLKAKMVPFGGWEMPLQYEGIIAEYQDTRKGVTIFDTSHMGEFIVEGAPVKSGLDKLVTQSLQDQPVKSCRYGALLNEKGGVMDDLIVYRLTDEKWMVVVNGSTTDKDEQQFRKIIPAQQFRNISSETGKLDIQGPQSRKILSSLVEDIAKLDYYTFDEFTVLGQRVIVSRTGYTGELGYEIYFPWNKTKELWWEILKRGAKPAGLGVRDVLRIEMGYSLYGHELEEHISPLEAGLNKFIDWNKDFIGKAALAVQKEHVARKIVCFVSENRRSPRAEQKIYSSDGEEVGIVTSGTFSPALERGVGLGFIAKDHGTVGQKILIGNESNKISAEIVKRPIYTQGSLKN